MVTGFYKKQRVEAARDAGVTVFLAKPVTVKGVGARPESLLNNPRRCIRSWSFSRPDRRRCQLPVKDDTRQTGALALRQIVPLVPQLSGPTITSAPIQKNPDSKRRALR